jgi:hypothetical protein
MTIVSIVEGDGEVEAVPVLLRRLCDWLTPGIDMHPGKPIKVHRNRFLKRDEEFRRMLLLAAAKATDRGGVLILLDADDDCPVELAAEIRQRASAVIPHRSVSVVCANREFEAWFLAAAQSLDGRRGLRVLPDEAPHDPDAVRGAKEWLSHRILDGQYRATTDQAAFAATFDLDVARQRSRSFQKLCSEWSGLCSSTVALGS